MYSLTLICGNVGSRDLAYTVGGKEHLRLSVATKAVWYDDNGNKQEKTTWHKVSVWGKQAKGLAGFLNIGAAVLVEGEMSFRTVDKDDGSKAHFADLNASRVIVIDNKNDREAQANGASRAEPRPRPAGLPRNKAGNGPKAPASV